MMHSFRCCVDARYFLLFAGILCLPLVGCGGEDESAANSNTDGGGAAASNEPAAVADADGSHGMESSMQGEPAAMMMAPGAEPAAMMMAPGGESSSSGGHDMGGSEMADSSGGMMSPGAEPSAMMMAPGGASSGASGHDMEGGEAGAAMAAMYGPGGASSGGVSQPGMPGQAGYGGGGPGYGASAANVSKRPADGSQWSDKDFLEAIEERDGRVVAAVYAKGETSVGDPKFAALMNDMLSEVSGVGSAMDNGSVPGSGRQIPGEPGYPPGLRPGGPNRGGTPPVPPGGAHLDGTRQQLRDSSTIPLDSIDVMLGSALLSYVPQAVQGTRGAATRLQSGMGIGDGSHDMSAPGIAAPGINSSEMALPGAPGGMSGGPGGDYQPPGYEPPGYVPPGMEGNYGSENPAYGGQGYGGPAGNQNAQPSMDLSEFELVRAIAHALVANNTSEAWQTLHGIVKGAIDTSLPPESNIRIVVEEAFAADTANPEYAQQILTTVVDQTFAAPNDKLSSFVVLGGVSQASVDHYLQLTSVAGTPPPAGPGMQPNGPGGPGPMGMQSGPPGGPGAGRGRPGPPGMADGGPGMGGPGMGGPGGGRGRPGTPGMAEGGPGMGGPGMEMSGPGMSGEAGYGSGGMGPGYDGDNYDPYAGSGTQQQPQPPASINIGDTIFNRVNVSQTVMSAAATALWSPASTASLAKILRDASDIETSIETLALAANVPSDVVRRAEFSLLSKSFDNGADALLNVGLTSSIGHDPGLLCVLKSLPRTRPRPESSPADPLANAKQSWVDATHQNVMALRDKLRVMSGNAELAYSGAPKFRLHRGAVPEASIGISVRDDAKDLLGESAPSEINVYYSRVQVAPERPIQMQELVEYYEKTAKGFKREYRANGILWLDGVKRGDGKVQSQDVIISQGGNAPRGGGDYGSGTPGPEGYGGGGGGGQLGQYTIETIVVIINDPAVEPLDSKLSAANN